MKSILPFDELNAFKSRLVRHFDERTGHIKSRKDCEDIIDELLDLYMLAVAEAVEAVNQRFSTEITPTPQEVQDAVYERVQGATWRDRVLAWYMSGGTVDDILRIAETEMTRIGNKVAMDTAVKAGATEKTWQTMMDDRVRDTHTYLENVTVPIEADFYTWDGDHAKAPGGFTKPENNVNCRCELTFG